MLRRFGKPYQMEDAVRAVRLCADQGFDLERCHCTWIIGVRGESLRHLFGTYIAILDSGGRPTPFPLTPIPGTREYLRHRNQLAGKDLSMLNGHLWPTAGSSEEIELYELLLRILTEPERRKSEALAASLPQRHRRAFEQAAARNGDVRARPRRGQSCPGGVSTPGRLSRGTGPGRRQR
jgi:hypothetical protein